MTIQKTYFKKGFGYERPMFWLRKTSWAIGCMLYLEYQWEFTIHLGPFKFSVLRDTIPF